MRKKPLNPNKERILPFIQNNPGFYLRQIRNELDLSMGSVQYHSYHLQKVGEDNMNF
jgi:predicted transcriptional regulator